MINVALVTNSYETATSRGNYDFQLFIDFTSENEKNDFVLKVRSEECRVISVNENFALIPLRRKKDSITEIDQNAYDELLSYLKAQYSDTNKFDIPLRIFVSCPPFDISGESLIISEALLTKIQDKTADEKQTRERHAKMRADLARKANETINTLLDLQKSNEATLQRMRERSENINSIQNVTPAQQSQVLEVPSIREPFSRNTKKKL